MSRDSVNTKEKTKTDMTWKVLIEHSEAEIRACREKIKTLNKSLVFFKKQDESGMPFPLHGEDRHGKIS